MKDLKYLTAFAIPFAALIGLLFKGHWVFFTPVFAFVVIPILESIMPLDRKNLSEEEAAIKKKKFLFDLLLLINIPVVFGLVGWFLWSLSVVNYTTPELVGLVFSVGIVVGSNGINVAHELGHRDLQWQKTLGKLLLLPALYMHFYIEHNYGHHAKAATAEDPASAKYNQSVYSFWFTSIIGQYINSWRLQKEILKRNKKGFFSIQNDLFWFHLIQLSYVSIIYFALSPFAAIIAVIVGVIGALLLETINYIEHYGLSRKKTQSGRYERVREVHSWNSNHVLGRIMLYELTRHSDHHYKSSKKYQLMDYHDVSPQMPFGYPTSMILSLVPPLWFAIMNKRIPAEMKS